MILGKKQKVTSAAQYVHQLWVAILDMLECRKMCFLELRIYIDNSNNSSYYWTGVVQYAKAVGNMLFLKLYSRLIFSIMLWVCQYFNSCFIDEYSKTERLSNQLKVA